MSTEEVGTTPTELVDSGAEPRPRLRRALSPTVPWTRRRYPHRPADRLVTPVDKGTDRKRQEVAVA